MTTPVDQETTVPSSSSSTQETPSSSQKYQTESTETTTDSQTSYTTKVSTSTLPSSPSGSESATTFPQETSPTAPGPAVTWSSTTLFTGHPTPLSGTSTFPPSTASLSSTVKTETSGVSLFLYGSHVGDQEVVKRDVDFTSPLFKPQIGFFFGSSLRDFLYFTDNGQIIFPKSKHQIFSYPNPPLRSFTGWDRVALVAPFWDDADFSSHRGTIFYQVYETLYDDDYRPLVVQQVESWIETLTNTWNYKARWTLKVTWVNAPAYPARWTRGTNTYQAILSTDGSRSFALFLYQNGGMQWDVTQRPGNQVLTGFSSGDGYYENSPLTFQQVWEKYRPDQFLNSSSGLRGLQVYKLHREERPNYRLRCLQWLRRQPQQPSRGWNQTSCPCSWQQGRWDLRFQPIRIDLSNRLLCSFSSWRGGVCCRYGPWGELLEGQRVQSPSQFEREQEPQRWCCRWNDQPSLCTLYQQRRPRIGCNLYQPPRPAWMFGDPHIFTLDGVNYTFNGLGDFLLIQAQDGNSSFLLQGRTNQTGSAQASNFIAFAAQYNTRSLAPITVQWFLEPNDTIHVLLNNQTVTFDTNCEDAEGQKIFHTTGVVLIRNGSLVSASLDGTVTISVTALSNILHASCSLPEEYRNRTAGLLGVWNDNPDDDFKMPNGTTISQESSEEIIFHYGMTWKINGPSLLGKRDDHLPSNFTPVFLPQLPPNKFLTSECNGNKQCIYDILATGNLRTGLHTSMVFSMYQQMNTTLHQFPPSIRGHRVVKAYVGQTKRIQYSSSSKDVTFTLRNNYADFKLFENGTLLWTPMTLKPLTLEILARNVKDHLTSVFQPKIVVCACKREKVCLYNLTSRVGNSSLEVANCECDGNNYGFYCERFKDPCEERCFPNVKCIPGQGCEACPPNLTGDGRHCALLKDSELCQNKSCPVDYCYNQGHCSVSQTLGCQPACTCPPAFTDTRCFLAGNNFTPTVSPELPVRVIQLLLSEEENASVAEVNASVAYRLENLDVRAFLWNSRVEKIGPTETLASGNSLQHWYVISEFQYRPRGPVIDFLNNRLLDAVVEAFFLQASWGTWKISEAPRNNVVFHAISKGEVHSLEALNMSTLETHFKCEGYKGYHLVYSPHDGFTCVSPCGEGYCEHGGQCQHLPDGPRCSCVSFSIYTPWGKQCEHLSVKLGAFFGILFGALGALLLLGVAVFVVHHFWSSKTRYSYSLDSES